MSQRVEAELASPQALVTTHTESVTSGLLETTVESFDRHYAVNVRGTGLLINGFARVFRCPPGSGRIAAFGSDLNRALNPT